MPSTTNNILLDVIDARAALIADPARAAAILEGVAGTLAQQVTVDLDALSVELAAMAKLARNGEQFWKAWGRLLGLEPAYTVDGVPSEPTVTPRIAVRG